MYKLNKNSASARFYKWIWGTDVTDFKTMCPYFWKYVLTIIFLPVILISKLIYHLMPAKQKVAQGLDYVAESKVGVATDKVFSKIGEQKKFWYFCEKLIKWTFFIGSGAVCLLMIIMLVVAMFTNPGGTFGAIGAVVVFIAIVVGFVYVFDEYNLKSKIAYPFKLFGNMIYSLYKNVCPMIKWE